MPKSERSPKPEYRTRSRSDSVRISDFELRISRVAGVVAERAFVAERLGRVNVALDVPAMRDGAGQNGFQFGQNVFKARPTRQMNRR